MCESTEYFEKGIIVLKKKKTYDGAGIYGLYNVLENKIYIGASNFIRRRFSQHRQNFKQKSGTSPMYKEPLDNFTFLILRKMSDEEFKKYGVIMEMMYISQSIEFGMGVYNHMSVYDHVYAYNLILGLLDVESSLMYAVKDAVGRTPAQVRLTKKENRARYCDCKTE